MNGVKRESRSLRSRDSRRWAPPVLATALVLAWLAVPAPPQAPAFLRESPVLVVAHQGASGHVPGDTLESFRLGFEMGAHVAEMDLHLTSDGRVVVIHDATVDRTTNGSGPVAGMTLRELKALDAGYGFTGPDGSRPYRGRGLTVPTLDEVFEAFPGRPLLLELKPEADPSLADAVAERIEAHSARDRVVVASFSGETLRRFRARMPDVATSFSLDEALAFLALGLHPWYRPPGQVLQVPEHLGSFPLVNPVFLWVARHRGLDVHVWTVNETADMERLLAMGVDGIITDYPDRLANLTLQIPNPKSETN